MYDLLPYLGLIAPLATAVLGLLIGRGLMRSMHARETIVFFRSNREQEIPIESMLTEIGA